MTFKTSFPYDPKATPWNEVDGIAWDDETTADLKRSLEKGDTIEEAAMFLQYWPKTVRAKMKELGLRRSRAQRRSDHGHRRDARQGAGPLGAP